MKKAILMLALAGITISASAQQMMNKKGMPIKPVAGDYGLIISAAPFLNYAGNFFGKTDDNNSPTFSNYGSAGNPFTISGRYFLEDNRALRVDFTLGISSSTSESQNGTDTNKIDEFKVSRSNIGIGAGYEIRRGVGRLVVSYGPQFMIMSSSNNDGRREFTDANNANGNFLEEGGNTLTFGVGGFLGLEYFFAPKMSVGGNFGLNLTSSSTSERTEKVGNANATVINGKSSGFGVQNSNNSSISLNFYF